MAQLTLQQAADLAIQHHRAGRLNEAEQLYRLILAQQPDHLNALHMLGVLMAQAGRPAAAGELIRRAIALKPNWPEAHHNLGNVLKADGHLDEAIAAYRQAAILKPGYLEAQFNLANALSEKGRLDEAIAVYRQATVLKPDYAEAHFNLGNVFQAKGQWDQAVAAYQQAIVLRPNYAEAYNNFGNVLHAKGSVDQAIAAYRQALALKPNYPEACNNLGVAWKDQGQVDQAMAAYRQAIALNPNYAEVYRNLSVVLNEQGQFDAAIAACRQAIALMPGQPGAYVDLGNHLASKGSLPEAIAAYRQALALKPDYAEAHSNLGVALREQGQVDQAIAAYRQAIVLKPNNAEAHNNLGIALRDQGQLGQAIAAFRQSIAYKPSFAKAYSNLGVALQDKGGLDEAIAAYRQAIVLEPHSPETHNNLGVVLQAKGQLEEAIAAYRQAIALKPDWAGAHSNLVYLLHYRPAGAAQAVAEECRRWNQQHAAPLQRFIQSHANDRDPNRRLRIGYVSADFREHASAYFLVPLLEHHNAQNVELFAYAQVLAPDAITRRLQQCVGSWRSIAGMSDAQVADQVRHDRIDILVDLKVHTAENRLLVFAYKPAPVQATWLGYPGSTGLTAIDYRLSDPYLDPPGMDESIYSEQTIRLPDSFWCYDPLEARNIPVNALPAVETGMVTFGSLNNFNKLNESTLALWGQVLRQVGKSCLLLLAPQGDHRQWAMDRLGRAGIESGRVEFVPRQSRRDYFAIYHRIDVALDCHPVNGHTTSLDSFWMGVPVVTLVGQTAMGRAGWSQLSNLGLTNLAGQTPEQFVEIAVGLAHDLPRLEELRATLRPRMTASPLMDAPRFAGNIESAYRQMWRNWCAVAG